MAANFFVVSFFFVAFLVLHFPPVLGNDELTALLGLKASLDPDGHMLASWSPGGDHCAGSFEGVACNELGKVANISLQGKGLTGQLSPSVSGLKSLSGLYLHYNSIHGEIPSEISNLTELSDLYFNMNSLSGEIPPDIGRMARLQVLQLSYNQLTGGIPTQLGHLQKLSVLALQSNRFSGAIPASLGNLSLLTRLDLSYNQFFGPIPRKLTDLRLLTFLDVTNNTLSGNVPPSLKRLNDGFLYGNNTDLCGVGFSSLGECKSSDQLNPSRPEPFGADATGLPVKNIPESANVTLHCDKPNCPNSDAKSRAVVVTIGIVVLVVGATCCGLFVFLRYRRRKQKIGSALEHSDKRVSTDQAREFYGKSGSPLANVEYSRGWDPLSDRNGAEFSQEVLQELRSNLDEVESATQYFSDLNLLGKSNYAATYKGILRDGSVVAVKRFSKTSCKSEEVEFLKGLKIITSLKHENLVRLKGFCCSKGRGECFLLYEFVPNGSLLQYLDVKDGSGRVLDWSTRVSIIYGIAKGIEYLHSSKPSKPSLVHQNISVQKVLLDKHYKPLLSDSGIHKLLANDAVFSTLKASAAMGYLAPEYSTIGRLTEKSDIYAFGVLVLQILSGKTQITHWLRPGTEVIKVGELVDVYLHGKYSEFEAENLLKMALLCSSEIPSERPTVALLIEELGKCSSISYC